MAILQTGIAKSGAVAYDVDNSCRFNHVDGAGGDYLTRTTTGTGSGTWTLSTWFKVSTLSDGTWSAGIFGAHQGGAATQIYIEGNDKIRFYDAGADLNASARVFRDPGSWYHLVFQKIASTSLKIYVNGELTDTHTTSVPATSPATLSGATVYVGQSPALDGTRFAALDGYLAEYYFIDGTALLPSDFGETNAATNQWIPKDAVDDLTFGTNGFYQKYGADGGHTSFLADGTYTTPAGVTSVDYLVVGGGGGGGGYAGGAGAGGYRTGTLAVTGDTAYSITVGDGGTGGVFGGGSPSGYGTAGGDSVFSTITSAGGGQGGSPGHSGGGDGGSGGGGTDYAGSGGAGNTPSTSPSQGFGGGNSHYNIGAGGGGASTVGQSVGGGAIGGYGGAGTASSITGTETYYAGGGGGGQAGTSGGANYGGVGGGGPGNATQPDDGSPGTANTGGGGGGGGYADGGDGGSGIVIIKPAAGFGLGLDSSGEGNNFTATNLVATDQMIDTPTNNWCTLTPLIKSYQSNPTFAEGNLKSTSTTSGQWASGGASTFGMSSGKWYWEWYCNAVSAANGVHIGIVGESDDKFWTALQYSFTGNAQIAYQGINGTGDLNVDGSNVNYGADYDTGDIIGVALDLDSGTRTVTFYFNNVSQGAYNLSNSNLDNDSFIFASINSMYAVASVTFNFGQDSSFAGVLTAQGNQDSNEVGDFYYEPPTDYLALCSDNLPAPEIALPGENFNTLIYTGDGLTPRSITGLGFQPDTVLFKARSNPGTDSSVMFDAVRGVEKAVYFHGADGETTVAEGLKVFDSDGFTVGSANPVNKSAQPEVTWSWKGDGVAGGATNTAGDIDTQVNVNTTAGFSIITYTGDGVDGQTIGHGLSQKPDMIWIYDLTGPWPAATTAWMWNKGISSGAYNTRQQINEYVFQTTPSEGYFTAMSSTLLTMTEGSSGIDNLNKSGDDYLMFCFHEIEGYSKFDSYEGNGNVDGPFIYTGFTPGMFFCKNIDENVSPPGDWPLKDNKRPAYNVEDLTIMISRSGIVESTDNEVDFVSNGIKIRSSDSQSNNSSDTMIYAAFAASPFKTSNAR